MEILKAAEALLPGATDAQGPAALPTPNSMPLISKAKGSLVTDVDGNQYLDLAAAGGSSILGHADETIVVATNKAAAKGCLQNTVSETQVRLAELIVSRIVAVDHIRFFPASGLATLEAIVSARRATDRTRIVRFDGCWHGCPSSWIDGDLEPSDDSLVLAFNDGPKLNAAFEAHGEEIAAVLLQPIAHGFGLALPHESFLAAINKNCQDHGALLIADESVSGFRVAPGGAAQLYNLSPDLTLLGDVIGGGLPLAAVGGKKTVLIKAQRGASADNFLPGISALAVSAGVATLQSIAETDCHPLLNELVTQLVEGIQGAAAAAGVTVHIHRAPGLLGLYFTDQPVYDLASAKQSNMQRHTSFYAAMLERGVLIPNSSFAPWRLNIAHTQEHMEQVTEAVRESLQNLT